MSSTPRRRSLRFAFSLRTLFVVVTIFGVWLGWNLSIVRERNELMRLLRHLPENEDCHVSISRLEQGQHDPEVERYLSWVRRMLGDEAYLSIDVEQPLDRQILNRLEVAFPEAVLAYHERRGANELAFRDSLATPPAERQPNRGDIFKTGLIEK